MNEQRNVAFSRKYLALAIFAAFGTAQAQDADIASLTKPESSVSAGVGLVDGSKRDRALFGQYTGMRKEDGFLLLDVDFSKRDDATGIWLQMQGRNLGLDNRELSFSWDRQGNWKIFGDYNEIVRHDPRTINTALVGAGSTTPRVVVTAPGTGSDLDLKLERKRFGLGGEKWITPNLQLEVTFKSEDKNGARLFGNGFTCTSATAPGCLGPTAIRTGWALLMLPEPINSTTRQFEAKLNYTTDKLTLIGGYYGSFYTNSNGNMTATVPGSLYNAMGTLLPLNTGLQAILQNPIALPPDNQAHQIYVSGSYAFTPTTRATFKAAYTRATQNDNFLGMGLTGAPGGRSDLDGRIDNTLLQFGLTSRPMTGLSLLANVKYENKEDKTPIDLYNIEGANRFTNGHLSNKKLTGKLEGSYQLPDGYRATLGLDYDSVDRGVFTSTDSVAGLSGLRRKNEEVGYRAELRRSMAENLNGSISYGHSWRDGSNWLKPNSLPVTGVTELSEAAIYARTGIFPASMTDRKRDKLRLMADWAPMDALSLQFIAEAGYDHYLPPSEKGLRNASFSLFSVDAAWTVSDNWKLTGYWSHGDQTQRVDHSTGYMAKLNDVNDTVGLGFTGRLSGKANVGGELSYTRDLNRYGQGLDPLASATNVAFLASSGGLPDVSFKQWRLKLYSTYAIEKNGTIRVDFIHERTRFSEWTWGNAGTPFYYSDGTTVSMNQNQNVSFLGASYIYRWQ
ncbi:MAG: MtrB/PioB family decaheme-associated outer membrane protein [Betaproteobacteria bacterium]